MRAGGRVCGGCRRVCRQQLASEDSSRRNMSDTIWSSLRMSLLMAGGLDQLAALTRERDLEPFKAHFDF